MLKKKEKTQEHNFRKILQKKDTFRSILPEDMQSEDVHNLWQEEKLLPPCHKLCLFLWEIKKILIILWRNNIFLSLISYLQSNFSFPIIKLKFEVCGGQHKSCNNVYFINFYSIYRRIFVWFSTYSYSPTKIVIKKIQINVVYNYPANRHCFEFCCCFFNCMDMQ